MSDLAQVRSLSDTLDECFRQACLSHGYTGVAGAYKAHDRGERWPIGLEWLHGLRIEALHKYYLLRDGPGGVLGWTKHNPCEDRPLAAPGLISYRARGSFGWVMIGAKDHADAMREAKRSTPNPSDLQIWSDEQNCYAAVDSL